MNTIRVDRGRIRPGPLLVLSLLVLSTIYFLISPVLVLQVKSVERDLVVTRIPVHSGTEFSIRYIHSVDRQPIWEKFHVAADGTIVLTDTKFKMLGAGMGPYEQTVTFEDGWNIVSDMNRAIGTFFLRVGHIAKHTLFINDQEIPLWKHLNSNERVKVEILKVPRITLLGKGGTA
ncbi:DUF1850 domain-containing protein [Calderihabitans maritimus]|uniref:DUF1850 domain-containing protein n=1 Tax=Calderihabitans maritimus TaxID=1246530 RepID=A0A1Z5HQ72_9FIRM|nr:DUF1850 domain-containing protein [Calderihabitans maritimus]GAW91588.1 hypothetical protein Desku_2600 [Calderihabitans maritimus]